MYTRRKKVKLFHHYAHHIELCTSATHFIPKADQSVDIEKGHESIYKYELAGREREREYGTKILCVSDTLRCFADELCQHAAAGVFWKLTPEDNMARGGRTTGASNSGQRKAILFFLSPTLFFLSHWVHRTTPTTSRDVYLYVRCVIDGH